MMKANSTTIVFFPRNQIIYKIDITFLLAQDFIPIT